MTMGKWKLCVRWSACRGSPSSISLAYFKQEEQTKLIVNSLLSGSFLIKFSSLSAPKKIEELTAGSDEKTQRSPAGNRTQGLANSSRTL